MLSNVAGRKLNIYVPDYIVFDLETTGTSPKHDEVIEISAIKVEKGNPTDEFSTLVNPGITIPYYATAVNGITDNMVSGAPNFEEALKDFIDFIGDFVLVGHNIACFDMKYIYRDCRKYFGNVPDNDYIDTLPIARKYLPILAHHRLTDLADYYKISTEGAHRALFDCEMNRIVFEHLREEMENPMEEAKIPLRCEKCGRVMKLRNGKYGMFYGCTGYPSCTYTMNAK